MIGFGPPEVGEGVEAARLLHPSEFHHEITNVRVSELYHTEGMCRPYLIMCNEIPYQLWMLP